MSDYKTADLCDHFGDKVQVVEEDFVDLGGVVSFSGPISTIKAFEDNSLVAETLNELGAGRVLVVDAGGSMRRAMLGDNLAARAVKNAWSGLVIYGCIRDSAEIGEMDLGVKCLGTNPRKTDKKGAGEKNVPIRFGGVTFMPGQYLYADEDGIVIADESLELPKA